MNEKTPVPDPFSTLKADPLDRSPNRRHIHWSKMLWDCNPFYLLSAGLLLYGCYRISTEPDVVTHDFLHLYFNFGSLQLYELLLVGTAIFLASRRIWYDSTLLIGLENLFLIVPFILISQGALVGQQLKEHRLTWELSLVAALFACGRVGSLKRFIGRLNFPRRMAALAVIFVVINATLPGVYRSLQEGKIGTHLDAGPAYMTNEFAWLVLLPGLCALMLAEPGLAPKGEEWPQRGWLPAGMYALWLAGTGAHLYCLGYIYDFDLRAELVAPALWILCWALFARTTKVEHNPLAYNFTLTPTALASFVAIPSAHYHLFFLITCVNAAIYASIYFRRRNEMALHLMVFSMAALAGGVPQEWGDRVFSHFSRSYAVWSAIAAYGVFWAMQSRTPVTGVFAAIISASATGVALGDNANAAHWATQVGLVVLLIHSLRWEDAKHQGAAAVRIVACVAWVIQAFVWVHTSGSGWMTCATSAPVLIAYGVVTFYRGTRVLRFIPLAAVLVILTGPGNSTADRLRNSSAGVSAVIASFVLFAAGTGAALYKHRRSQKVAD